MARVVAILAFIPFCLGACTEAEQTEPEVVEVRWWDEGCQGRPLLQSESFPPDTLAYPPGRRSTFRVVSLGGCVDGYFYEQEHRLRAVLDSLGLPDSSIVWPFDHRLRLAVHRSQGHEVPAPLDSALTFALWEPSTDAVAFFGFSDELGLLWGEVHQGPSFRLSRVERQPGDSVALAWSDTYWPPGGPTVESEEGTAVFDSLWRIVQPPPPPPPAHRGI